LLRRSRNEEPTSYPLKRPPLGAISLPVH
jgi:hypothetical protein